MDEGLGWLVVVAAAGALAVGAIWGFGFGVGAGQDREREAACALKCLPAGYAWEEGRCGCVAEWAPADRKGR
jgi:hypothetical protein